MCSDSARSVGGSGRRTGMDDVRRRLTERVLDGWDPAAVREEMARLRAERPVLAAWARNTQPQDSCRWDLRPEMDYLD